MKAEVLHCPNCNGTINDTNISFCPYCGSRLFINDGTKKIEINKTININKNSSSVVRNEAEIRRAELANEKDKREHFSALIGLLLMCIVGILGWILSSNWVEVNTSARDYEGRDYELVVSELKGIGFKNITVKPVPMSLFKKEGEVERISINGDAKFKKGASFHKRASIIITYYHKDDS